MTGRSFSALQPERGEYISEMTCYRLLAVHYMITCHCVTDNFLCTVSGNVLHRNWPGHLLQIVLNRLVRKTSFRGKLLGNRPHIIDIPLYCVHDCATPP